MKALVLVDIQNDFLPGGALAVHDGDKIIPVVNALINHPFDVIVATMDWHPKEHGSFAMTHNKSPGEHVILGGVDQVLWPVHCVRNTPGAEFSPRLHVKNIQHVFHKGTERDIDSYSAFFDNGMRRRTGLENYLKHFGVKDIYIAGLATDYCVRYSALDAVALGFNVFVIEDACKGIDLEEGDSQRALEELRNVGVEIIKSTDILK